MLAPVNGKVGSPKYEVGIIKREKAPQNPSLSKISTLSVTRFHPENPTNSFWKSFKLLFTSKVKVVKINVEGEKKPMYAKVDDLAEILRSDQTVLLKQLKRFKSPEQISSFIVKKYIDNESNQEMNKINNKKNSALIKRDIEIISSKSSKAPLSVSTKIETARLNQLKPKQKPVRLAKSKVSSSTAVQSQKADEEPVIDPNIQKFSGYGRLASSINNKKYFDIVAKKIGYQAMCEVVEQLPTRAERTRMIRTFLNIGKVLEATNGQFDSLWDVKRLKEKPVQKQPMHSDYKTAISKLLLEVKLITVKVVLKLSHQL